MVFIRYIFVLICFYLATASGLLDASEIDLPDLGDSAGSIISPEQERNIAKSFMRELRRQAPLETDEEIVDYLNQLGEELGKNANYEGEFEPTWGNAKCPKFNIVGSEELNNLELATIIAEAQGKELKYELVDFHSSRPGHDLRYALDGEKMKQLGWVPAKSVRERIADVTRWTLDNERWITL